MSTGNGELDRGSRPRIPRDGESDYTREGAARRREFVHELLGTNLEHIGKYSFDPALVRGNIENFIGSAQVPIGLCGPVRINGEHAQGDFLIPLATTEGTLVASFNRGMRLLTDCGGVKVTVVQQSMQRAPVFIWEDARQAREFGKWIEDHLPEIKASAESSTRVGKLVSIGQYPVGPLLHLRFNFTSGDAAGQNMTGKATLVACEWIKGNYPGGADYILSGNMDTDKKHSQINTLATRGRRVVAEAVIPYDLMKEQMGVDPRNVFYYLQVASSGAFMAGSANNAAHAANALAALFIATGQDVANVAESHAAITYCQLRGERDLYWSITLPSLIVATHGGGTGLATQHECLQMLGCVGAGTADKFAEICGAVVLAGELSLAAAILHGDWVSSHERYGRNRG